MSFPLGERSRSSRGSFVELGLVDGALIAMGGFVLCSPTEVEVKRMRVHPDFQRRGLGRLLLEQLESRARSIGGP
ncbi:MAG: GNAT family N-acetyltransferase [Solirubrobacterales bacterium]